MKEVCIGLLDRVAKLREGYLIEKATEVSLEVGNKSN